VEIGQLEKPDRNPEAWIEKESEAAPLGRLKKIFQSLF
jgi:hypothetical protein